MGAFRAETFWSRLTEPRPAVPDEWYIPPEVFTDQGIPQLDLEHVRRDPATGCRQNTYTRSPVTN